MPSVWRASRADGEGRFRPYGGGRLPRHAAAWAALLLASGCTPGSPCPEAEKRPRVPEARRWVSVSWDTVFLVGGSPADTLFLLPTRLAANEAGVSVLDRLGLDRGEGQDVTILLGSDKVGCVSIRGRNGKSRLKAYYITLEKGANSYPEDSIRRDK